MIYFHNEKQEAMFCSNEIGQVIIFINKQLVRVKDSISIQLNPIIPNIIQFSAKIEMKDTTQERFFDFIYSTRRV